LIASFPLLPPTVLNLLHATLAKRKYWPSSLPPDIPLDVGAMRILPEKPAALAFVVGRDEKPQNIALVQSFAFSQIVEQVATGSSNVALSGSWLEKFSWQTFRYTHTMAR
jgi:hypothetical protein